MNEVDEHLTALTAAVERGCAVDPVAESVLVDPLGVIELQVSEGEEASRADGLFGRDGYVLASDEPAGAIMSGACSVLPHQLALLTGLGPRPVPSAPEIGFGDLDALAAALQAGDLPPAVAAVLRAPDVLRWTAHVSWVSPDGPAHRYAAVFDAGAAGLVLGSPRPDVEDDDGIVLATAGSTDVWRALCALLPEPTEIAPG